MNLIIRNYEEKDFSSLRTLMVLLQDAEKLVEPDRLIGKEMADKYLEYLLKEIQEKDGKIFLAEVDGKVVGFLAARVELKDYELINKQNKGLYISDVSVDHQYQGQGIGKMLLEKAAEYAKDKNLSHLRLEVLAGNRARKFYEREGFKEYTITMVNDL